MNITSSLIAFEHHITNHTPNYAKSFVLGGLDMYDRLLDFKDFCQKLMIKTNVSSLKHYIRTLICVEYQTECELEWKFQKSGITKPKSWFSQRFERYRPQSSEAIRTSIRLKYNYYNESPDCLSPFIIRINDYGVKIRV